MLIILNYNTADHSDILTHLNSTTQSIHIKRISVMESLSLLRKGDSSIKFSITAR